MDSSTPQSPEQLRAEIQRLRDQIARLEARRDPTPLITGFAPYGQPIWFDAVSDAIIVADPTWRIQQWNQAAEQIYGWPRAAVLGRPSTAIIGVVRYAGGESDESATHALATAGTWRGTIVQHTSDGRELMIDGATWTLYDEHGAIAGYIAVNRDVTERSRSEQALQRAADRLQVLADASHAFAEAGTDAQRVLDHIAQISADAIGAGCVIRLRADDGLWLDTVTVYDHDPALQSAVADHFLHTRIPLDGPNPAAVVVRSGQALLMPRIDLEVVQATVAPALWSALAHIHAHSGITAPLRAHGQILGVLSFARYAPEQPAFTQDDLTLAQELADRAALAISNVRLYQQAQTAQQAAAETLARLDALVTSVPSGIGYLDHNLRYQLVNPALAALNGRTPAEHLGRTPAELMPGLALRLEPIIRQVLATGQAVRDIELRGLACPQDGELHDWLISYFPVPGPTGAVSGVGVTVTNITQSKRTAAALHETERKLGTLFDLLPVGVAIFDAARHVAYVNPALEQIMRMGRAGLFQGAHLARRYLRADNTPMPPEEYASVRARYASQTITNLEIGFITEAGEVVWTSISAAPVDFPDWRVVMVTADITARKQAEAALRESETRYRMLFETMAQGAIYQDADGQIIDANPAAERILGQSLSQLQGRTSQDPEWRAIHDDGSPFPGETHPGMVALRTGQALDGVVMGVYHPAHDAYRWICIQAMPQFRPGEATPSQVYTIFEDITERRRLALLRTEERQQLEAILQTMSEGVLAFRPNGAIIVFNAMGRQLVGLDPQAAITTIAEALAQSPVIKLAGDGQLLRPEHTPIQRLLRGERVSNQEIRIHTANDPSDRWLSFSGTPVFGPDGALTLAVLTTRDITQRKRDEAALQAHAEALSRANVELTRAMRLKDEFLAMMSHELRTPLTVILGISEALDEEIYGPVSTRQRQALATVIQSGQHLLAILSDILDLAYIEAGQAALDLQPISVEALCRATLQLVQTAALQQGIRLRRSVELGVEGLRADERRLTQILVNLLDNAIKFTPAGGVAGLEVSTDAAQERIELVVWDTGIGIAEDDYVRLFQPFTQVDGQLSRQYGGVGLGLTLVRRLVDLHGGSIRLESALGQGSRFTVSLPWAAEDNVAPPAALPAAEPPPQPWAQPPKVVLADDHEPTLAFYLDMLSGRGCQVAVGRTGEEALAQVRATPPDVAVLDIQMPGMDGLTAIRHIRADPDLAGMPIIALTALAMPGDRERCLAAGANIYLAKPVGLRTLIAAITALLAPAGAGEDAVGG